MLLAHARHAPGPVRWTFALALLCVAWPCQGQPAAEAEAAARPPAGWQLQDRRLGLGWWHYEEPDMRLQGPAVTLQLALQPPPGQLRPDVIGGELLLATLDYRSNGTGSLSGVPGVGWGAHALWAMPPASGHAWRLGLAYEGFWNDLQGSTSNGYRGYERMSNRLWLQARARPLPDAELQLGVLLRGWQDSWLSQADTRLPDVRNVQKSGLTLRYRHSAWQLGSQSVQPWVRYTWVGKSDEVGAQRWYEPRNRTLDLGIEARF